MTRNIGRTDQIIRIVSGIAISAIGYYAKSWWGLVGLALLLTGFIGFCPLYYLLHISTRKKEA